MKRRRCCVAGCDARAFKGSEVSVHAFPKDEERRQLWQNRLKLTQPPTGNMLVCSLHFPPEDFRPGIHLPDVTIPLKKRALFRNSVPSLNIPKGGCGPYAYAPTKRKPGVKKHQEAKLDLESIGEGAASSEGVSMPSESSNLLDSISESALENMPSQFGQRESRADTVDVYLDETAAASPADCILPKLRSQPAKRKRKRKPRRLRFTPRPKAAGRRTRHVHGPKSLDKFESRGDEDVRTATKTLLTKMRKDKTRILDVETNWVPAPCQKETKEERARRLAPNGEETQDQRVKRLAKVRSQRFRIRRKYYDQLKKEAFCYALGQEVLPLERHSEACFVPRLSLIELPAENVHNAAAAGFLSPAITNGYHDAVQKPPSAVLYSNHPVDPEIALLETSDETFVPVQVIIQTCDDFDDMLEIDENP